MEKMLDIQVQTEQRLNDARNQHTEQCQVSNVVLTHSLDEMATVAYQLQDMCIGVDRGREETWLVYNHIKSALGMEKEGVDYLKAYEGRCRVYNSGTRGRTNRIQAQAWIQGRPRLLKGWRERIL